MDDSFQFIIESPQHSQSHKKHPRLVTSCGNWYIHLVCSLQFSRSEIKCLRPSAERKCEACPQRSPVIFVTGERSRAITGPNSGLYATQLRCALFKPMVVYLYCT
ncbi:hypothetical protein BYT27DRAFT_7111534 [Phlegmacium glaucopus]|nr:hypothetical protein BYT27DRAFT_7111534 [Phlegmacium glaucopus]